MRELIQSRDEEMQRVFREDLAEWLSHLIDQNIEAEKLLPELESGVLLCKLAILVDIAEDKMRASRGDLPHGRSPLSYNKKAQPGQPDALKNVKTYLQWVDSLKLSASEALFNVRDLTERLDDDAVLTALACVGSAQRGVTPPRLFSLGRVIDNEELGAESPDEKRTLEKRMKMELAALGYDRDSLPVRRLAPRKYTFNGDGPFIVCLIRSHIMLRAWEKWATLRHFLLSNHPLSSAQSAPRSTARISPTKRSMTTDVTTSSTTRLNAASNPLSQIQEQPFYEMARANGATELRTPSHHQSTAVPDAENDWIIWSIEMRKEAEYLRVRLAASEAEAQGLAAELGRARELMQTYGTEDRLVAAEEALTQARVAADAAAAESRAEIKKSKAAANEADVARRTSATRRETALLNRLRELEYCSDVKDQDLRREVGQLLAAERIAIARRAEVDILKRSTEIESAAEASGAAVEARDRELLKTERSRVAELMKELEITRRNLAAAQKTSSDHEKLRTKERASLENAARERERQFEENAATRLRELASKVETEKQKAVTALAEQDRKLRSELEDRHLKEIKRIRSAADEAASVALVHELQDAASEHRKQLRAAEARASQAEDARQQGDAQARRQLLDVECRLQEKHKIELDELNSKLVETEASLHRERGRLRDALADTSEVDRLTAELVARDSELSRTKAIIAGLQHAEVKLKQQVHDNAAAASAELEALVAKLEANAAAALKEHRGISSSEIDKLEESLIAARAHITAKELELHKQAAAAAAALEVERAKAERDRQNALSDLEQRLRDELSAKLEADLEVSRVKEQQANAEAEARIQGMERRAREAQEALATKEEQLQEAHRMAKRELADAEARGEEQQRNTAMQLLARQREVNESAAVKVAAAEQKLEESEARASDTQNRMNEEISLLRKNIRELQDEHDREQASLAAKHAARLNDEVGTVAEQHREQLMRVEREASRERTARENADRQIAVLEAERIAAESTASDQRRNHARQVADRDDAHANDMTRLQAELDASHVEIREHLRTIADLRRQIAALESQLSSKSADYQLQEARASASERRAVDAEKATRDADATWQAKIREQQDRIDELTAEIRKHRDEKDELQRRAADELRDSQLACARDHAAAERAAAKLRAAEAEIAAAREAALREHEASRDAVFAARDAQDAAISAARDAEAAARAQLLAEQEEERQRLFAEREAAELLAKEEAAWNVAQAEANRLKEMKEQDLLAPFKKDLCDWLNTELKLPAGSSMIPETLVRELSNGVRLCELANIIDKKEEELRYDEMLEAKAAWSDNHQKGSAESGLQNPGESSIQRTAGSKSPRPERRQIQGNARAVPPSPKPTRRAATLLSPPIGRQNMAVRTLTEGTQKRADRARANLDLRWKKGEYVVPDGTDNLKDWVSTRPLMGCHYKADACRGTPAAQSNIQSFIAWAAGFGLEKPAVFEVNDLMFYKSQRRVLFGLYDVARLCRSHVPRFVTFERMSVKPRNRTNMKADDVVDQYVGDILEECCCSPRLELTRLGPGKYMMDNQKKPLLLQAAGNKVVIRVGGGWGDFREFLRDKCRCFRDTEVKELRAFYNQMRKQTGCADKLVIGQDGAPIAYFTNRNVNKPPIQPVFNE